METRNKLIVAGATVLAIGAPGVGVAQATSDDDGSQEAITGSALEQAKDAALAHVGEGEVTETEVGDEESLYEVEVTRDDGSQIDVELDADFQVVGDEADDESEGSDDD